MPIFDLSSYSFNPHAVPFLLVGISILVLGIKTLRRNPKDPVFLAFFATTLSIAWWLLGAGIGNQAVKEDVAFFWNKIIWIGVIFISPSVYAFTVVITELFHKKKRIFFSYLAFVPFLIALPFNLVVESVYKLPWFYYPRAGVLEPLFLTFFFAQMLLIFFHYFRALKNPWLSLLKREQIRLIFIGFLFAYLGAFDYLPNYGIRYYPLGYIPIGIWISIVAYTILRRRLFEVTPAIAAPTIIATMADPLFVAQEDGRVIIVNEAASATTGLPARKIIGEPLARFLPGAAMQLQEKARALSGKSNVLALEEETALKTGGGKEIPVSVSAAVIRDPSGHPAGITVICHNLSKIKEYVAVLARQKQELEEINAKLIKEKDVTERINKVLMEREMRIIELKKKVEELEKIQK